LFGHSVRSSFVALLIVGGRVEAAYSAIIPPSLDHALASRTILDVAWYILLH
jgi:hypothetical protein